MTAQITLNPDPPQKGKNCTICFVGGTMPNTLRRRTKTSSGWGAWEEFVCNSDNGGCVTVPMPSNATDLQVEDPSGQAPVRDVPVV